MSDSRLGKRYSDGLYEAAMSENEVDKVADALKSIDGAFSSIPELAKYWSVDYRRVGRQSSLRRRYR